MSIRPNASDLKQSERLQGLGIVEQRKALEKDEAVLDFGWRSMLDRAGCSLPRSHSQNVNCWQRV